MNPLLASGMELMLIGMGAVFVFLALLVLVTGMMSSLINKYALDAGAQIPSNKPNVIDNELIQVIKESVYLHRRRPGRN